MTTIEDIIAEFVRYQNDTDWQEMNGDKLVDIDPEKWLRKKLTSLLEEIEGELVNLGAQCPMIHDMKVGEGNTSLWVRIDYSDDKQLQILPSRTIRNLLALIQKYKV